MKYEIDIIQYWTEINNPYVLQFLFIFIKQKTRKKGFQAYLDLQFLRPMSLSVLRTDAYRKLKEKIKCKEWVSQSSQYAMCWVFRADGWSLIFAKPTIWKG